MAGAGACYLDEYHPGRATVAGKGQTLASAPHSRSPPARVALFDGVGVGMGQAK